VGAADAVTAGATLADGAASADATGATGTASAEASTAGVATAADSAGALATSDDAHAETINATQQKNTFFNIIVCLLCLFS
jgi:hypothetical protein